VEGGSDASHAHERFPFPRVKALVGRPGAKATANAPATAITRPWCLSQMLNNLISMIHVPLKEQPPHPEQAHGPASSGRDRVDTIGVGAREGGHGLNMPRFGYGRVNRILGWVRENAKCLAYLCHTSATCPGNVCSSGVDPCCAGIWS
jgi:hypothetical protein